MSRRLATISLMTAWLCASGAMLDVAQVAAWARMFAGYARTESVVAAARETFDPAKPCAMCKALGKAREACDHRSPAVPNPGVEKIILISERVQPFVVLVAPRAWPRVACAGMPVRGAEVPVPPPRFGAA